MTKVLAALCLVSQIGFANSFGSHGNNGRDGLPGQDGTSGIDVNFAATGQTENLNLSGTDGRDGRSAESGSDAWGCSQPVNVPYNLQGADGGNGGRGGAGGSGGSGGDVRVTFRDISNLQRIYIRSTPGRGGYGGYGGRGGRGCYCTYPSWQVTTGTTTQTYSCRSGDSGSTGYNGSRGSDGSYGKLTLVSQLEPLGQESPTKKIPVESMVGPVFEVSKHVWEARTGAKALFAPGSDITDKYTIFTGTVRRQVSVAWDAERPLADFAGKFLYLSLSNGKVDVSLSSDVWIGSQTTDVSATQTHVTVKTALFQKEALQLKAGALTGVGADVAFTVKDEKAVSNLVGNKVQLKYFTRNGAYYLRWQGTVPAEALSIVDNEIKIAIGKLPIKPQYLEAGKRAMVQVWVTRSLGSSSATKSFQVQKQLVAGD